MKIEFSDNSILNIDYKIHVPNVFISNFTSPYNNDNFYFFNKENNIKNNLNEIKWDLKYKNLIKYKYSSDKKVNVIY